MVSSAEILLYFEHLAELLGEFCCKSDIPIRDYLLWHSIVWEYLLGVESCYAFHVDRFLAGYEDGHLRKSLVSDCEDGIESIAVQKFDDEVECDGFEWERM